jgi:hypothetical protein
MFYEFFFLCFNCPLFFIPRLPPRLELSSVVSTVCVLMLRLSSELLWSFWDFQFHLIRLQSSDPCKSQRWSWRKIKINFLNNRRVFYHSGTFRGESHDLVLSLNTWPSLQPFLRGMSPLMHT